MNERQIELVEVALESAVAACRGDKELQEDYLDALNAFRREVQPSE